ncbi:hypothetical protein FOZ63_028547, partial [Perkinsus olseni]
MNLTAPNAPGRRAWSRLRSLVAVNLRCIAYCSLYCLAGPALILLNAHIYNKTAFPYPITVSSLGTWVCALVTRMAVKTGLCATPTSVTNKYWLRRIVPLGVLTAIASGAGNNVYRYLSVSFTQMLKAETPVYILIVMLIFRVRIPSCGSVIAVILICIGTCVASVGELKFSWTGFALQTAADISEATKLVLLQTSMADDKLSPFDSLLHMSMATAFCQACLGLLLEPAALPSVPYQSPFTIALLSLSCLLGVAVNLLTLAVINCTSGLAMKLLGIFRNNLPVVVSVLLLQEKVSTLQFIGYSISVLGFLTYTYLQSKSPHKVIDSEPTTPEALELGEGAAEKAAPKSKGSTEGSKAQGREAETKIATYMKEQNRPYSAQNVFDNLHSVVPKAQVQNLMEKL